MILHAACLLLGGLAIGGQAPDSIAATLDRQFDHIAVTNLLRDCRVDEAWQRVSRSPEHPESEPYRLRWAAGLRACGADDRADELLAQLVARATSANVRIVARARLAEQPARRGEFDEAVRLLREIGAEDPRVALRIGWLERRRGRDAEALEVWRAAERERPFWALRLAIVETLGDLDRPEEALAAWRRPGERWHHLALGDSTAEEDLIEARLLLAAGEPAEARARLEPHLAQALIGSWEVWVESLHAEGQLAELEDALAKTRDPARARVVRALFELHLRADREGREGLWSAALGRGPLGSNPDYAARLFLRTDGAAEHARAQLEGPDDLHALAFLARLGDARVLRELQPRLAAARDGLRDDGTSLLYVLTLLGTPAAHAALWGWTVDPVLGDRARRVSLRFAPSGPPELHLPRLEAPLD